MLYEILRLSSGWLLTMPEENDKLTTKFITDIREAFPLIEEHAGRNPPPFGSGHEKRCTEIYMGQPGS